MSGYIERNHNSRSKWYSIIWLVIHSNLVVIVLERNGERMVYKLAASLIEICSILLYQFLCWTLITHLFFVWSKINCRRTILEICKTPANFRNAWPPVNLHIFSDVMINRRRSYQRPSLFKLSTDALLIFQGLAYNKAVNSKYSIQIRKHVILHHLK